VRFKYFKISTGNRSGEDVPYGNFNQPACNNNEVMFAFFDDLKSKNGFTTEDKI